MPGFLSWAGDNWFILLQSVGIIGGLLFTAASFRWDARSRQIGNLMAITENHREIWSELYDRPELSRVMDDEVNLTTSPITRQEEWFIRFLITHLNTVYRALKDGVLVNIEGLQRDIRWFFSLPLPNVVWEKLRPLQDSEFIRFVELCLAKPVSNKP